MLTGKWGSGKTAIAKILAKSIACRNVDTNGEPCDVCAACGAVNNETYDRDVIYLNGEQMSAQEVDNVLEKAFITPAIRDAAKVFIVDETQGLSPAAINKFLNATQNPTPGYYFIFTTMNKLQGKNPGALQSRCKQWKMKEPKDEEIYQYLGSIVIKKKLQCPKEFLTEGLAFIAEHSEKSYRQAIQMLQQCYDSSVFEVAKMKDVFSIITYDDVLTVLTDISHGRLTENLYTTILGSDYQDKFPLILKIVGDAATYRVFGTKFVDESEKWKWKTPGMLAEGPHFDRLCAVLLDLSKNAYIKRGEFTMTISNMLHEISRVPTGTVQIREETLTDGKKVVARRQVVKP
jgi:DNA polymerase III delta prime subunit